MVVPPTNGVLTTTPCVVVGLVAVVTVVVLVLLLLLNRSASLVLSVCNLPLPLNPGFVTLLVPSDVRVLVATENRLCRLTWSKLAMEALGRVTC